MAAIKGVLRAAHRAAGLAVGMVLVLLGLTGSINVFGHEIDGWLHPQKQVAVEKPLGADGVAVANQIDVDGLFAAVDRFSPGHDWLVILPHHPGGNAMAWTDTADFRRPYIVTLDPRGEVVSAYEHGSTLTSFVYQLHATLFLGERGFQLVGALGVALLFLMLSAVPLAFASLKRIGDAFRVHRGKAARFNYDLHRASGVWTLLPMALITITGIAMVFPDLSSRCLNCVCPERQPMPCVRSTGTGAALKASEAARLALQQFPQGTLRTLRQPAGPDGAWEIGVLQPGDMSHFFPATTVWVDARAPRVLAMRDFRRFSLGESFLSVLHALHNGSAFGLFGRIAVFILGLVPAVLFVTGLLAYARRCARRRLPEAHTQPLALGAST
jgi:uncharacterized iron-regulated membrane protein